MSPVGKNRMDARIHPRRGPDSGLLAAAARQVLEPGLPQFRLLALRLRDDAGATTQVLGLIKLFFGQWNCSLFH